MSEDENANKGGQENENEFKAPASQEELDRIISTRLDRERAKFGDYDDLKAKAVEYDKAQEASKSELQKVADRAAAAEKERDELRKASLRAEVALSKGLTASQAKRLVGSTKEELVADADELLADLAPIKKPTPKPKELKSGSSGEDSSGLTGKERAAAALRQLRSQGG